LKEAENFKLVVNISIVEKDVIIVIGVLGLIENELQDVVFATKNTNCGTFNKYLLQL
jgi:hypothetical protein